MLKEVQNCRLAHLVWHMCLHWKNMVNKWVLNNQPHWILGHCLIPILWHQIVKKCEKESKKEDNPPESNMEDYQFNDEVVHSPQKSPLPSFVHVTPVVATTSANNTTSIFKMAPMKKLDIPTLATPTTMISTFIVEHVHNNCNFGGPSQGQIREDLEGQGHIGAKAH